MRVETVVLDSAGLSAWLVQDRSVVMLTSDLDDMRRLCGLVVQLIPV